MDENTILAKLTALDRKISVIAAEHAPVSSGLDGLVPAAEAAAISGGALGGKGFLPDGTDINSVVHGGTYFLNPDYTYKNVPFVAPSGNYRMQLTVIRNFGNNPWTSDPLIYQQVSTIEFSGDMKTSHRFYYGKWIPWYFDQGKIIWSGSQLTNGTNIIFSESLKEFGKIRIYWNPYNAGIVSSETIPTETNFSVSSINTPNTVTTNPAVSMEEVHFVQASDGLSATVTSGLYYINSDVTYSTTDSKKSKILKVIGYKAQ